MIIPCPTTYYTHSNSRRQHSARSCSPLLCRRIFRDYTDRIYTSSILNAYKNRDSDEDYRWKLILAKAPSNVDRYYKLRYLKKVVSLWLSVVGKNNNNITAMLNYKDFYRYSHMPNYRDVRRSSAGIYGWTRAGPFKHAAKI